jgi:zinc transporter, ZIP family
MELGLIAGLWVGGSTILGAMLTLLRSRLPGTQALPNLDFALGMMLAASAFSLLLPAAQGSWAQGMEAFIVTILMALLGAAVMFAISRLMSTSSPAKLFVVAMMLHNLPEGLAGGAAFVGLSNIGSSSLISAIMIQNIPEGFATVLAFRALGLSGPQAMLGGIASGLVELMGGGLGGMFVSTTQAALPSLLALAGGAMLQVTLRELTERFHAHPPRLYHRLMSGAGFVLLLTWAGTV